MARWVQELETYNLTVVHHVGLKHSNADALSQRPCKVCERQEKLSAQDSDDECDISYVHYINYNTNQLREETVRAVQLNKNETYRSYLEHFDPDSLKLAQNTDPNISPL
jgi:hypothetical protein